MINLNMHCPLMKYWIFLDVKVLDYHRTLLKEVGHPNLAKTPFMHMISQIHMHQESQLSIQVLLFIYSNESRRSREHLGSYHACKRQFSKK